MLDQASQLRRLVAGPTAAVGHGAPDARLVVVSGGKPGVGATTLAVNLATALAADALRVVLIDADFVRADVATSCGLNGSLGLADVLTARRSIHEAIQRGPAGLQVVSGSRTANRSELPERAIQRLVTQIRSLGPHADWIVIDAGNDANAAASRLWLEAGRVLLVTSPDAVAVMDTYATVKTILSPQQTPRPVELVVNHADPAVAQDVFRRVDQSTRRFLGLSLELAAALPTHEARTPTAVRDQTPLALSQQESPFARAIQVLAERLTEPTITQLERRRLAA